MKTLLFVTLAMLNGSEPTTGTNSHEVITTVDGDIESREGVARTGMPSLQIGLF